MGKRTVTYVGRDTPGLYPALCHQKNPPDCVPHSSPSVCPPKQSPYSIPRTVPPMPCAPRQSLCSVSPVLCSRKSPRSSRALLAVAERCIDVPKGSLESQSRRMGSTEVRPPRVEVSVLLPCHHISSLHTSIRALTLLRAVKLDV